MFSRPRHRRPGPRGPRAAHSERGAVAIEGALVFTLLFTILAGVVDVSMLFRTTYEVSSASRAGARLAAQEPLSPDLAADAAQQVASAMDGMTYSRITKLWVYKANPNSPTGEPASDSNCTSGVKCVKFTVSDDDGHPKVERPLRFLDRTQGVRR